MNKDNSIVVGGVHNSLCGHYKVMVVDSKTREVVADYGWHKNLILNQGMDLVSTNSYAGITTAGVAGTGSRPNKITSSNSTITQSGTLITLWPEAGGLQDFTSSITSSTNEIYYSASLQPGDVVVYFNSSRSNVVSVSGLNATVDTSYAISSGSNQTFTIWKTSQSGLQKEVKRSTTYLTGVGNCGSTDTTGSTGFGNVRTYRRTYDFTAETTDKLYTEIGTAPSITSNTAIFSRVLLPIPIAVSSSFQLRLIYDLAVEFTPTSQRVITASISGWPFDVNSNTHASESIQNFLASTISAASGVSSTYTALLEPGPVGSPINPNASATNRGIFVSSISTSLAPFGQAVNRGTGIVVGNSTTMHYSPNYVTGSYRYYKGNSFGLNVGNTTTSSGIWCLGLGMQSADEDPWSSTAQAITVLFHNSQSKFNTQVVSMSFVYSWDRTLAGG
jgi:hypothetical protein